MGCVEGWFGCFLDGVWNSSGLEGDDLALLTGVVAGVVLPLVLLLLASSSSDDSDESELITFGLDAPLGLGIEEGAVPEEAEGDVLGVGSEEGV